MSEVRFAKVTLVTFVKESPEGLVHYMIVAD